MLNVVAPGSPAHPDTPLITTLHRLRSPLARVGYGLVRDNATLLILVTGNVSVVPVKSENDILEAQGPRLVWLPPGDAQEIKAEAGSRGELLTIRDTAIVQSLLSNPLGETIRRTLDQRISMRLEEPGIFLQIADGLAKERSENPAGAELGQQLYLALLLLHVWRRLRMDLVVHGHAPEGLAERFIALAGQHLHDHWPVAKYAETLQVPRGRLGTAVQRATGMSPQSFLLQGLLREAGELLVNTGMPVSQIAFQLGYSDAGYFNRLFSRKTGISPGRFRRKASGRRERGHGSYAAWP